MKFKAFYIFGQKTVDVKNKFKSGHKDISYGGLISCRCADYNILHVGSTRLYMYSVQNTLWRDNEL